MSNYKENTHDPQELSPEFIAQKMRTAENMREDAIRVSLAAVFTGAFRMARSLFASSAARTNAREN